MAVSIVPLGRNEGQCQRGMGPWECENIYLEEPSYLEEQRY